ncbi:MAG TPA: Rpn family recombination-promoting nuclease/putative transposase [Coxiellaceae bacterium]|nr:Rpn family recombination-promoting nuclease/putative transposase [Coxiellaceae bacterium]
MLNTNLYQAHDALAKRCLTHPAIARDWLEVHLPSQLKELCDLSSLQIEATAHVEEDLKQIFSDVIYSLQINGTKGYIFVLVEHQSQGDELLPYRLLRYQVAFFKRYLEEGHKKLPLTIPMVLYHGVRSPYPYSLELSDCFVDPKFAKQWLFKTQLVDLTLIDDDEILQHKRAALLEMAQRHVFKKNILEFLDSIKKVLTLAKGYSELQETNKSVIHYLLTQANYPKEERLVQRLIEPTVIYREDIMTAAEQLRQEGRNEGLNIGRSEGLNIGRNEGLNIGRNEERHQLTQKMLAAGLSKELVEKIINSEVKESSHS